MDAVEKLIPLSVTDAISVAISCGKFDVVIEDLPNDVGEHLERLGYRVVGDRVEWR